MWIANGRGHVHLCIEIFNTHDFHAVGNNLHLDADRSLATGFERFAAGLAERAPDNAINETIRYRFAP